MTTKLRSPHLPLFQILTLAVAMFAMPRLLLAENHDVGGKSVIPEIVEPLDVWERIPEEAVTPSQKKVNPKDSQSGSESSLTHYDFFGGEDSSSVEENQERDSKDSAEPSTAPFKPQRRAKLSKSQLKRIKEARGYLRWINRLHYVDPRGEREIRLCNADLNNYGLKADLDRLLRSKASSRLKSKERAFKRSIDECGCDVIAVQGVLGRSYSSAREALQKLAAQLESNATEGSAESPDGIGWAALTGAATGQFSYNGFLIRRNSRVSVIGSWSHDDIALPQRPGFKEERFFRAPYEVLIELEQNGGDEHKQLRLINFDLRKGLVAGGRENEAPRLQMGEALRRLTKEIPPSAQEAPPLTYLMGELEGTKGSATELVLSGKLPLEVFGEGKPCSLGTNGKYRCTERLYKPQEIFSLSAAQQQGGAPHFFSPQSELSYAFQGGNRAFQKEGRARLSKSKSVGAKTSAVKTPAVFSVIGDFAAGSCPFKNGTPQGALFYLDLNW